MFPAHTQHRVNGADMNKDKNLIILCCLENPEARADHVESVLATFGPTVRLNTESWWVRTAAPLREVRYALANDPGPVAPGWPGSGIDDDFYIVNAGANSIDAWQDARLLLPKMGAWAQPDAPSGLLENPDSQGDNVTPFDPDRFRRN
ncbi:hypothetical protein EDD55_101333 [Varunaivibrio sulfuroxidans]|uniref:Uncharacterized protein n=2 Tax=Varunaivibrio sulfuroxidans TaxID=1773489 RepID=A0A4R3JJF3_9PROT|nr:hypothetical protein EDD55_101333 [Varunaivibrio sulfuroxidans]